MLITSWENTTKPIKEFSDFTFVDWENDIYPKYKGKAKQGETDFVCRIITSKKLKRIVDFGVGGGYELTNILDTLKNTGYGIEVFEANEVDNDFISQASGLFSDKGYEVTIHKADWNRLDKAIPPYNHKFDFGFLLGNSLTYIGDLTRQKNKETQRRVIDNFSLLIEKDGYFLVDTRDYAYISKIVDNDLDNLIRKFTFEPTVYYHGAQKEIIIIPVYMDETRVCLHYYDRNNNKWSLLQVFRVYHDEIIESLSNSFVIEKIYYDFKEKRGDKTSLVQYLAKRR